MLFYSKRGKYLIPALFFISTLTFAQGWNQTYQLNIPFGFVDLCTNVNGNNLLVYRSETPYIKYYLINTTGQIVRSSDPFETQPVEFPSIDGNNDRVYVVYKLGNLIKTWKSTDAGLSWSSIANINIGNNVCNNIDITFGNDNALHIVWATRDNYPFFKTYYRKLPANGIWTTTEDVTNGNYVGGFPTVSTSTDRVHVSYNSGMEPYPLSNLGDAKSRDKYITNWQTPQLVWSEDSKLERIHAGSSKLFDFYYQDMNWSANLYVKSRDLAGIGWSNPFLFDYGADPTQLISADNTNDNKTHVVYVISGGIGYRSYNGSWSSASLIINNAYYSSKISSVSNDLFVVASGYGDYIYYRQYDANPLAPKNLQVTHSSNNHPYLTWSANTEPDIDHYIVEKSYQGGWLTLAQTTNTFYEDPYETYCTAPPPQQCEAGHTVIYHVIAVDKHPFSSQPSEVKTYVNGSYPDKQVAQNTELPDKYELEQNYPNPFNPTTSINYQVKEKGFVSLKVYDMLGREVANLVNETQDEGKYSVIFNAASLPSGVYIYSLRVNDFVQNNKMTLMK